LSINLLVKVTEKYFNIEYIVLTAVKSSRVIDGAASTWKASKKIRNNIFKNIKLNIIIIRLFTAVEKYEYLINENELFNAVKIILLLLSDDIFYFFAHYTVLCTRILSSIWFSTFLEYNIIILHRLLLKKISDWIKINVQDKC